MRILADASRIPSLLRGLENSQAALDQVVVRTLNKVGKRAYSGSVRGVASRVRLTASYVREKMVYRPASSKHAIAEIVARRRATRLATYVSRQLVRRAPRAKGDPLRGIAPGQKQAGVLVGVNRGESQRKIRSFFFIPLMRGSDKSSAGANGMGVFVRTGPGRNDIEHKYGPSVDQVFRQIIPDMAPDYQLEIHDELQREALRVLDKAVKK